MRIVKSASVVRNARAKLRRVRRSDSAPDLPRAVCFSRLLAGQRSLIIEDFLRCLVLVRLAPERGQLFLWHDESTRVFTKDLTIDLNAVSKLAFVKLTQIGETN